MPHLSPMSWILFIIITNSSLLLMVSSMMFTKHPSFVTPSYSSSKNASLSWSW